MQVQATGEAGTYYLRTRGKTCDICESTAGEYAGRPDVPLHDYCDCYVQGPATGGDDCTIEYRAFQQSANQFTETKDWGGVETCEMTEDTPFELRPEASAFERDEMDGDITAAANENGWTRPSEPSAKSVDLEPGKQYLISADLTIGTWIFIAEKWEVCAKEDPVAGIHLIETFLGAVGGGYEGLIDFDLVVSDTDCGSAPPSHPEEPRDDPEPGGGNDGLPMDTGDGRVDVA